MKTEKQNKGVLTESRQEFNLVTSMMVRHIEKYKDIPRDDLVKDLDEMMTNLKMLCFKEVQARMDSGQLRSISADKMKSGT